MRVMTPTAGEAPSIDIVIPALNEEATIGATISAFAGELPSARFVIADNGSTDRTRERALEALASAKSTYLLLSVRERGKGNAIREAFRATTGDIVVMVDADDTYPASRVHDLVKPITDGHADMVVGDRLSAGDYAQQNERPFHEAGNRLVQGTINRLYGGSLGDILSGYRAFSRRFIGTYPLLVSGFELETDLSIHALDKRLRVVDVPVEYRDRPAGSESKLHTFRDGARVIFTLFNLFRRFRPLAFFGTLSIALVVAALCAGALPVRDYLLYQYVYHVPLAILAATFGLAALIFFAVGLVLDGLADQARREFELRLLDFERRSQLDRRESYERR